VQNSLKLSILVIIQLLTASSDVLLQSMYLSEIDVMYSSWKAAVYKIGTLVIIAIAL